MSRQRKVAPPSDFTQQTDAVLKPARKSSRGFNFKPGHPKYSGSKKGTTPRIWRALRGGMHDKAVELGVDPFEVLLLFAKGDTKALNEPYIDPALRLRAACEAAEYLYPKRRSIELSGGTDSPLASAIAMTPEQRAQRLAQLASMLNAVAPA